MHAIPISKVSPLGAPKVSGSVSGVVTGGCEPFFAFFGNPAIAVAGVFFAAVLPLAVVIVSAEPFLFSVVVLPVDALLPFFL